MSEQFKFEFAIGQVVRHKADPHGRVVVVCRFIAVDSDGKPYDPMYQVAGLDRDGVRAVSQVQECEMEAVDPPTAADALRQAKEQLVAEQHFEKATRVRDILDKLMGNPPAEPYTPSPPEAAKT